MGSRKDGGFGFNSYNDERYEGDRPNKFLYKGTKHKSDPWRPESSQQVEDEFIKPKSGQRNNKRANCSPGFDLDDVWSIRKNVQVSSSLKNGSALKTSNKSFYSRHGGFGGNAGLESSSISKRQKTDDFASLHSSSDAKSWSTSSRSGYSYSDKFGNTASDSISPLLRDEFDDLLDSNAQSMVAIKNKLNNKLHMPGAPQIAPREMSARTKKAHNLHQAHLKASGMGQYTPGIGQSNKQMAGENNIIKWESDDFL